MILLAFLLQVPLHGEATSDLTSTRWLTGDLIFEQLGEGSGLASQVVTGFAEDGDGFLWISSQGGLQRWDGYRLTTYKSELGVADSLPDNLTQLLHTDSAGRVWVGASSGGLARYDREHNKFIRYRESINGNAPINVESIEDDGQGGLWVGGGTGLDHLDGGTGKFTHMTPASQDGFPAEVGSVRALHLLPNGALLIGSDRGLLRTLPGSMGTVLVRVQVAEKPQDPISVRCFFVTDTTVWIGTDHGIYSMDSSSGTAHRFPPTAHLPPALFTSHISSIAADVSGGIWVGTQDQGVFAITPSTWSFRQITHDPTQATSLADDWINNLFLSRQGIMWIGSRRGVSFLDTTVRGAVTLLGGDGRDATVRDTDVYSILQRHDGTIWLGLSKNGVDVLSPAGQRIAEIRSDATARKGESENSLPNGTVGALRESRSGDVYIVTEHGLYLAENADIPPAALRAAEVHMGTRRESPNGFSPRLKHLMIGAGAEEGLYQAIPDLDKRGHEMLWLGGANGLWKYDPGGIQPAVRPELNKPLTDPRIQVLLRGAGNTLWVGTLNGLNRIDIVTGEVQTIAADPTNPQSLAAGMISSLLLDRRGRLWVATFGGGINVLQGFDLNGKAQFHRVIEALPNDSVDCLLEAADGKIWASTDGGLASIDPFNFDVEVLGRAEGAILQTYWDGVGVRARNGDLLFGGSRGLTIVRPSLVVPWTYTPPLVVTSARIGTTEIPLSRFNNGPEEYPVWIAPDLNNLTVEFAALDYTAPFRNHYEYKLEGFDRDWIAADPTRRMLRYTNLPPARYTLLLRGSNRDGVWAQPRRINILVLPKWYQKAWFRIFAFLAILFSLLGIFLLATAYMRRQQRELERQVDLRTAELEQKTVELKTSQQKLEHMAYTDSLTGLPNRRMFTEHFRRLLALKRRQQGTFALLLMDFDRFKVINDTHGHDAGDAVLKEMASRMSAIVRESDCLARLGGDEYGLILGQSPDVEAIEMVCQKIVDSFTQPVSFQGVELRTSPSIGVAFFPDDGKTQDKLYKSADLALYEAKRNGGNGCARSSGSTFPTPAKSTAAAPLIAS